MNNSYRVTQRNFLSNHAEILDLDDVGDALFNHLARQLANDNHTCWKNRPNRLLAVCLRLNYINKSRCGQSIITRECNMGIRQDEDHVGYAGELFFRTQDELKQKPPTDFFKDCLFHIGAGGYSTWNGPWQNVGRQINELEQGVPWELRECFGAYAFAFQFYLSDFPSIGQMDLMMKLSDKTLPKSFEYYREEIDLEARDNCYMDYLRNYKKSMLE